MNKINYQLMLDEVLGNIKKNQERPRLLLHVCCAPCSSYVVEYLSEYFDITLYFYNPNISPREEYVFRAEELSRLVCEMPSANGSSVVVEEYNSDEFYNAVKGLEGDREGGGRCKVCYRLRLEKSAEYARNEGFDYFTTTLSISPYKNASWLNEIGEELSDIYGVKYLFSDFKKRNGYKRSCELSELYSLYRQSWCGCEFSKRDSLQEK
jgi:predicted adenine nucleotide alpha hydrolase (AANH) superfamily ATPase